jgi:hypothetical protein
MSAIFEIYEKTTPTIDVRLVSQQSKVQEAKVLLLFLCCCLFVLMF